MGEVPLHFAHLIIGECIVKYDQLSQVAIPGFIKSPVLGKIRGFHISGGAEGKNGQGGGYIRGGAHDGGSVEEQISVDHERTDPTIGDPNR